MSKSPSFQFFPSDWLSSRAVRLMDAEQRGWYIQLLAESWESDTQGTLPSDDQLLRVLANVNSRSTDVEQRWEFVKEQFKKRGQSVYNERLMDEVVRQELNRSKKSEAGKASAEARRIEREAIKDQHLTKVTRRNRRATPVEQEGNTEPTESALPISVPIPISIPPSGNEERPAKKQRDERTDHPAIVAFREVKGTYPNKDVWDLIIKALGDTPDIPRMRECWVAWRAKDYKPNNIAWVVDWYVNGIQAHGSNGAKSNSMDVVRQAIAEARQHEQQ